MTSMTVNLLTIGREFIHPNGIIFFIIFVLLFKKIITAIHLYYDIFKRKVTRLEVKVLRKVFENCGTTAYKITCHF